MTKLEYVINHVCECVDEKLENVMQYCPDDWFMSKELNICSGKQESLDCKKCWNMEKPIDRQG